MNLLKWVAVHALHWAILYGAFVAQMDGAMYVLKFVVWTLAPLSLVFLADQPAKDAAKKTPQPVRVALSWLQAWATLGALVWSGHIATGAAWALVMLMIAHHQEATRKARAAAQAA